MRYVVLSTFYFLFIAIFLSTFSPVYAKSTSILLNSESRLYSEEVELRSNDLKYFLVNETVNLVFNSVSNRLWLFWDTDDGYSISTLELGKYENVNDCEASLKYFYTSARKIGIIHDFCLQKPQHVILAGVDVFFKGYSSIRTRFTGF